MKNSSVTLTILRVAAVIASILGLLQLTSGFGWMDRGWHGRMGEISLVLMIVAAVCAYLWSRRGGNRGLFMHAAGMAVIGIVQVGLGEMDMGWSTIHQSIGVLYVVGVIALAVLSFRKPLDLPEAEPKIEH
ncbi:hypothetical protein ACQBAT_06035 [Ornithinimicrobium sp. Y1847]|uniref:hypothetical protein n=1 Tax=unclassified Ornithinimicrobium TaxID=2615080 RepID=UPI003B681F14